MQYIYHPSLWPFLTDSESGWTFRFEWERTSLRKNENWTWIWPSTSSRRLHFCRTIGARNLSFSPHALIIPQCNCLLCFSGFPLTWKLRSHAGFDFNFRSNGGTHRSRQHWHETGQIFGVRVGLVWNCCKGYLISSPLFRHSSSLQYW